MCEYKSYNDKPKKWSWVEATEIEAHALIVCSSSIDPSITLIYVVTYDNFIACEKCYQTKQWQKKNVRIIALFSYMYVSEG